MFTRVEARRFRSLRAVEQNVGSFRALVGPNGSGKTTFLDVVALLGDLMRNRGDVRKTVFDRSFSYQKLLWLEQGADFQLAVEAKIPDDVRTAMAEDKQRFTHVRYQVQIGLGDSSDQVGLDHETLWLFEGDHKPAQPRLEFPRPPALPESLLVGSSQRRKAAITKKPGGNDNYYTEGKKSYMPSFRLGRGKSALANVPADVDSFPVSTWFQRLLEEGVQTFALNGLAIRQPSPPGSA